MSSLLEVRGLSKEFSAGGMMRRARLHAVDDVSFALEPGRITALAGESVRRHAVRFGLRSLCRARRRLTSLSPRLLGDAGALFCRILAHLLTSL